MFTDLAWVAAGLELRLAGQYFLEALIMVQRPNDAHATRGLWQPPGGLGIVQV